jgi:hypothetical protein
MFITTMVVSAVKESLNLYGDSYTALHIDPP